MYSDLLVPVDRGLESNSVAIEEAAGIAEESGGVIHALFVYPAGAPEPETASGHEQPKPLEELEALLADRDVTVTATTAHGTAAEEICSYADEHDIEAIVMATYGRTGFRRLALGSTTEDTIRQSPCPVIAVTDDR
jgi:nucleotide-binding universal stress UspA family protein